MRGIDQLAFNELGYIHIHEILYRLSQYYNEIRGGEKRENFRPETKNADTHAENVNIGEELCLKAIGQISNVMKMQL